LSGEQVRARTGAPTRRRNASSPWRGPPKAATSAGGNATSASATSSCSEVLPNSMLRSCPASCPTVAAASEMRTSKCPRAISAMDSTRPTISERTKSSVTAESGISTLCSTAMARARSSIARASQRT
jgi:hypothetical protein